MTPFEAWTGIKPKVKHLQSFGCTAYVHIPRDERKKLHPKAKKCMLLGYGTKTKKCNLYDPASSRVLYLVGMLNLTKECLELRTSGQNMKSKLINS